MLRETSTRIGSRLLFAAEGGTSTTGRNRMAIKRINVSARRPINSARVPAPSGVGMRAYASQASTSALPNASA